MDIRSGVELPARREDIELHTADGLTLVGELALPLDSAPARHPGDAASAAHRRRLHGLPHHPQGRRPPAGARRSRRCCGSTSAASPPRAAPREGALGAWRRRAARPRRRHGVRRRTGSAQPVAARLVVRHRDRAQVRPANTRSSGAILLSPPLKRTTDDELAAWAGSGKRLVAVVPEFDDYLRPAEAARALRRRAGGRGRGRRGRQAPLGGGAADPAGAHRDPAARQPCGTAAAEQWPDAAA